MVATDNRTIARMFIEGMWNDRNMNIADQLISPNLMPQGPMTDQFPPGPEGTKMFTTTFINAFPDVHATIDHQDVDGDLVQTDVTFRGTQTGQLMDIPPTNRKVAVQVRITDRIRNGKIVESWSEWDPNDLMRQLGVS
jgi:predicted ester cyclase